MEATNVKTRNNVKKRVAKENVAKVKKSADFIVLGIEKRKLEEAQRDTKRKAANYFKTEFNSINHAAKVLFRVDSSDNIHVKSDLLSALDLAPDVKERDFLAAVISTVKKRTQYVDKDKKILRRLAVVSEKFPDIKKPYFMVKNTFSPLWLYNTITKITAKTVEVPASFIMDKEQALKELKKLELRRAKEIAKEQK